MLRRAESFVLFVTNWAIVAGLVAGGFYLLF